jgi:hypothetical protein
VQVVAIPAPLTFHSKTSINRKDINMWNAAAITTLINERWDFLK